MKKYFLLGVCLIGSFYSLYAGELDSLFQVSQTEKDPQRKCEYYLDFVYKLASFNRDSAVGLLIRYEDSCGTSFDFGRYRAQSLRAFFYCFEAKYEQSLKLLHVALAKQKSMQDASGMGQTYNRLGVANNKLGRPDLVLKYLKLAQTEFIRVNDSARLDVVLNNMGGFLCENNKNKEAINYFRQSLQIRLNRRDFYWVGYTYFNLGVAYLNVNKFDSSGYYFELAVKTFETKTETGKVPPMIYLGLAKLYQQSKRLLMAYKTVQKGLEEASKTQQTELLLEGKLLLSTILSEQGKHEQAYTELKAYLNLKSSVDSSNNAKTVADLEAKYLNTEQALQIVQLSSQKKEIENKSQLLLFYSLGLLAIIIFGAAIFSQVMLRRNQRRNQREKLERAGLNAKIAEAKLLGLRAQMNPHFIFNSLNTAQNFVMNSQQKEAYEYLSNFAKLLRMVMENSSKNFIPLEDELEQIKLYIDLEAIRFKDKFNYTFQVDSELANGLFEVPGMLIQPIVENAIGHGLINRKDDKGYLILHFRLQNEAIVCEITDNGVGRKCAAEIKAGKHVHYKSAAIPNVQQRLSVLQKEIGVNISITITDLYENGEAAGTSVVLVIPYK